MRCKLLNLVNEAVFEMKLKPKPLLFGIWKIHNVVKAHVLLVCSGIERL